jgi:predicted nucleotidyltransferase
MSKVRLYNKNLCPLLWKDNKLDSNVRIRLLKIAKDFYEKSEFKAPIKDIYLIGSAANYNWTPDSDLDIHVLIDFNQLQMPPETAKEVTRTAASRWNEEHNIEISGHPVEINIQPIFDTKPHVTGIYSIAKDKWIRVPQQKNLSLNRVAIVSKYNQLKDYIEKAIATGERDYMKSVKEYIDAYRQYGLDLKGELSLENIVFKILRSRGIMKKLKNAVNATYDKELSLPKSVNERFHSSFTTNMRGEQNYVEIFRNPSRREIKDCERHTQVGAILLGSEIYIWDRDKAYHYTAMQNLVNMGSMKDMLPLQLFIEPKGVSVMVTDATRHTKWYHNSEIDNYIKSHPFFRTYKILDLFYFDQDIVGDWGQLEKVDEVTQKDLRARHPQPPTYVSTTNIPWDKLTLDNLKALRDKIGRSHRYFIKGKGQQHLTPSIEKQLEDELEFYNKIDNEIRKRISLINAPVNEGVYMDFGHNKGDYLWKWSRGESLTKIKTKGEGPAYWHTYILPTYNADYCGRYDVKKNIVTVASLGGVHDPKLQSQNIDDVPDELVRLLKFEFGDDVALKRFYEEGYGAGKPEDDPKSVGRWTVDFESSSKILKESPQIYTVQNNDVLAGSMGPHYNIKNVELNKNHKHFHDSYDDKKWRHKISTNYVFWWERPEEEDKAEVNKYLKNNYNVNTSMLIHHTGDDISSDTMLSLHMKTPLPSILTRQENLNEMPKMTLKGKEAFADDKPLKTLPVEAVKQNIKKEGFDPTSVGPNPAATEGESDPNYYQDQIRRMRQLERISLKELLLVESPKMNTLKDNRKPLTDEERKVVMDAGAVWHHGPNGEETPAIWKSIVKGKTWYVTNTHRCYQAKPTLKGAIKAFQFIETTA